MKGYILMETRFSYFYGNENEQYIFLQMPLMLLKDERFKGISDSAKILYSLFLNRTSLSAKNGWLDEEGKVYIIYTLDSVMEDMNCCRDKASKSMKELRNVGLTQTIRVGLGNPNIIYVMNFATDLKYQPRKPEPAKESERPVEPLKSDIQTSTSPICRL
jgi:hypothetical protein